MSLLEAGLKSLEPLLRLVAPSGGPDVAENLASKLGPVAVLSHKEWKWRPIKGQELLLCPYYELPAGLHDPV